MRPAKRLTCLGLCLCLTAGCAGAAAAESLTVHGYSEGLAQAQQGGQWGFAAPDGSLAIPARYDSVVSFDLGMAAVNLHGKLGVIRTDGQYLIEPKYDSLMPIGYGLYTAQQGAGWGVVSVVPYMDGDGNGTNEVYPLTYAGAELGRSGGLDALILTDAGGRKTTVPLFRLPELLEELGVDGSKFPLTKGKLPTFSDVGERDWYSLWVDIAYNTGIMAGTGEGAFEPTRTMTVAEALQMAANMDSRFLGDDFHTTTHTSAPWYNAAVSYCLASGIISRGQFDDYQRTITRRELAQVFAATALARSLPQRGDLLRVSAAVQDVDPAAGDAAAIYGLYAKGILTGVDEVRSFNPDAPVTRAEAAALAARLARPEQRVDLF